MGYGTEAINLIINNIVCDYGLCGEIESIGYGVDDADNKLRKSRLEFYKRLGFNEIDSLYKLYDIYYTPIIYCKNKFYEKKEMDKIMFDYYKINIGELGVKERCEIIK